MSALKHKRVDCMKIIIQRELAEIPQIVLGATCGALVTRIGDFVVQKVEQSAEINKHNIFPMFSEKHKNKC